MFAHCKLSAGRCELGKCQTDRQHGQHLPRDNLAKHDEMTWHDNRWNYYKASWDWHLGATCRSPIQWSPFFPMGGSHTHLLALLVSLTHWPVPIFPESLTSPSFFFAGPADWRPLFLWRVNGNPPKPRTANADQSKPLIEGVLSS